MAVLILASAVSLDESFWTLNMTTYPWDVLY
jgi:hypothetical protein